MRKGPSRSQRRRGTKTKAIRYVRTAGGANVAVKSRHARTTKRNGRFVRLVG